MWPVRTIFFFLFFWAGCLMSLLNPIWGIVNYMLVYQVNPGVTWWGEPLAAMGVRFSFMAAIFTLLGLFVARKHVPRIHPTLSLWEAGAIGLVLIAAMNLFIGIGCNDRTFFIFEKLWKLMLFVLILVRLASTRENLKVVLWTLVIGTLYIGWDAYNAGEWRFVLGRLDKVGGADISTTSGVAAHLVAMLPLIGTAFLLTRDWRGKLLAAMTGAFAANAVIMCRTRSAFVGFCSGLLAAVLLTPKARRHRIYACLVVAAAAGFSLTDNFFWERMATLTTRQTFETDRAAATRVEIWEASVRIFADHPFGIGTGNFARIIGDYDARHYRRDTHNSLVECFVELGVQGGVVFLSMVMGAVWLLYRSAKLAPFTQNPLETKIFAYGFFISFITYFVTALGTQRLYTESFWWVLALPLCLHRVVEREMAMAGAQAVASPAPLQPLEYPEAGQLEPAYG